MRWFILTLSLLATPAFAGNYVLVCTAPCIASDGTTQPAGTVVNRIIADPTFSPGAGLSLQADTGQAMYAPPAAPVTTIPTVAYVARFTQAEQLAIVANQSGLALWLQLLAYQSIDLTNSLVTGGMAELVGLNLVTQARATVILTP